MKSYLVVLMLVFVSIGEAQTVACPKVLDGMGYYDKLRVDKNSPKIELKTKLKEKLHEEFQLRVERGSYKLNDQMVPVDLSNRITRAQEELKSLKEKHEKNICKDYNRFCMSLFLQKQNQKWSVNEIESAISRCRGMCDGEFFKLKEKLSDLYKAEYDYLYRKHSSGYPYKFLNKHLKNLRGEKYCSHSPLGEDRSIDRNSSGVIGEDTSTPKDQGHGPLAEPLHKVIKN